MFLSFRRSALWGACLATGLSLAACGSFDSASHQLAGVITPYKMEIVQGNFVSKEQVAALKPGMGRQQVRDILGTPLVVSLFHADRWDYVFTLKRQGVEPQARKLVVFFNGDVLDRFEGDEMPSEAEFVDALDGRRKGGKVPVLEASQESLQKFAPAANAADAAKTAAPAVLQPPATIYPPLESTAR